MQDLRSKSPEPPAQLLEASLIKMSDVEQMVSLKRASVYDRVQKGTFPAPIKLSAKCSRWRFSQVRDWIEQQASGAAA